MSAGNVDAIDVALAVGDTVVASARAVAEALRAETSWNYDRLETQALETSAKAFDALAETVAAQIAAAREAVSS